MKQQFYTLTIATILVMWFTWTSNAGHVPVGHCAGGFGSLEAVNVSDCDQAPCILEKGKNYTILLTFVPKDNITSLMYNATASVFGLKIPIASGDACNHLVEDKKCPLEEGVPYSFVMEAAIGKHVPTVPKVLFIGKFSDENNKVQACGTITLSIR